MDLKERLIQGEILSYLWLPTHTMWADLLTKEANLHEGLEYVLLHNKMGLGDITINQVMAFDQEDRMVNIRNRKKVLSST